MSFKRLDLYPCNPATTRGEATRLSSSNDKIVYTNGRTVIIRDLKNPTQVIAYPQHVQSATVARISPSGYYCASGDAGGTVRIWDIVGDEQTLKAEYRVLANKIKDLAWDGESKRIIAIGEGRDKFGHAFMVDSGSSTGEIIGHSKAINSVAIRHQRPCRAATGGDDTTIVFHTGVPFKYERVIKTHTKYVQDIKYAPSGDHFASVGSDSKIFVYDGKTGDTLFEFTDSPHKGTINSVSYSPDSKSFVTSSSDCTVKLWDIESQKAVTTWSLGSGVNNHQVGNTWTGGEDIVSLSLSGDLNIFDKRTGDKPVRVLQAPSKSITAAVSTSSSSFIAGVSDGRVVSFSSSEYSYVDGPGHTTLVSSLAASSDGTIFSAGYDDTVREITGGASFVQGSFSTASQPKSLAVAAHDTVFVAEVNSVEAIRSNQKVHELKTKFAPSSVAASGSSVAIGGEDHKVRLYDWDGKALKEVATLDNNRGAIVALAFSPDGTMLAAGDSAGKILLYNAKEHNLISDRWVFHSGRVLTLAWAADGKHCASGALDTHVVIWSVEKPLSKITISNAAAGSVSSVFWLTENVLASAGADGIVKTWQVTFRP